MTDGIIQKVFRRNSNNYDASCSCHVKIEFDRLEQELIEEIKLYLNEYGIIEHENNYPCHQIGAIREKLIGDTN